MACCNRAEAIWICVRSIAITATSEDKTVYKKSFHGKEAWCKIPACYQANSDATIYKSVMRPDLLCSCILSVAILHLDAERLKVPRCHCGYGLDFCCHLSLSLCLSVCRGSLFVNETKTGVPAHNFLIWAWLVAIWVIPS